MLIFCKSNLQNKGYFNSVLKIFHYNYKLHTCTSLTFIDIIRTNCTKPTAIKHYFQQYSVKLYTCTCTLIYYKLIDWTRAKWYNIQTNNSPPPPPPQKKYIYVYKYPHIHVNFTTIDSLRVQHITTEAWNVPVRACTPFQFRRWLEPTRNSNFAIIGGNRRATRPASPQDLLIISRRPESERRGKDRREPTTQCVQIAPTSLRKPSLPRLPFYPMPHLVFFIFFPFKLSFPLSVRRRSDEGRSVVPAWWYFRLFK